MSGIDFDLLHGSIKAAFGDPVRFFVGDTGEISLVAEFRHQSMEVQGEDGGPPTLSRVPTLGLALADLPRRPKRSDKVFVRGKKFVIIQVDDDGEGWARIALQAAEGAS